MIRGRYAATIGVAIECRLAAAALAALCAASDAAASGPAFDNAVSDSEDSADSEISEGRSCMRNGNVIDFVYEWYRRNSADRSNRIGELALGKCEDAFMRRDWQGFAQWHGVFGRARRSAGSGVGNGSPRGGRGSRPTRD